MGDWNAIVGENTDGREVGKYGLGTRNERGDRLVEFCRQHDLVITNTLFMNHKRRRYTYKMPGDINRYQLDYIMVKNRYKNQIKSSKSYPGADIDSDHNLVMIKSILKFKKLEKPKNKGHKWNLCQLKQPEIRKLFEKKCKEKLETKSKPRIDDCNNIEHGWRRIKESIVQSAEEILTREKPAPKREWITMEIVQDIERRRLLKNKTDEESKRQYKTLRNKINREAKKAKEMWIEKNCEEIDNMMKYNQQDKAYKLIKRYFNEKKSQCTHVKDKEGNLLIDEIAIANRWKEYVEELYGEEINTDLLVETPTDGDFDSNADTRILKSEFEDALQTMKKNKAPGPDELNTELLQQTGDEIKNALYELLCQIYETGKIPRDFGCSRLVILPKKPRANQCENFRTLSLISHAAKLLAIIVSKRISKRIEARLANDQYGFRKNKGTREAILGLRVIIEKQIERQKITYMAFVDLEKAFDSLKWTKYSLKINAAKTKALVCYKKNIPSINITLENKEIIQVDYFKYLGSIITDDGKSTKEIRSRIGQAKNTFLKKKKILTSKNMNIVTKKRLIKTYVWSVALYGSETWTINKKEKDMLEALEMWCWRKMQRISWTDRRSNEDILRTIDEKRTFIDIIKRRRWQMIGHTLRHGDELHSLIIEGMIEGTRSRGRPRTRYISQIMQDGGVTSYRELKNMANDREKWRSHLL
ncbi:uncharacterized protein LOC126833839 [Adelges cooleyi]|uniref:uncharacterized protein LOC126833839 n=1 Tax=Adelges cooleyi TaxID=133065 RepID=UPI002180189F|nr:uncharacterized protein LOC126833839 [Adelges cooleyi]